METMQSADRNDEMVKKGKNEAEAPISTISLSAPFLKALSPPTAPSFEEGEIRDDELETMQSADRNDEMVKKGKDEATEPISTISLSAPVSKALSPPAAPSFEEGKIWEDESEAIQSADRNEEMVKNDKSEAAAPSSSANVTKKVGKQFHRNLPSSGPFPSAFYAPNQLAPASKGLSYANPEWSKSGQSSLDDSLKQMRMNAKKMDKNKEETGKSALRMQIKYPNEIDLNLTPSDEPMSPSVPSVTHSLALAQPNLPNLGQLPVAYFSIVKSLTFRQVNDFSVLVSLSKNFS
jgi:hypothetical protein